MHSFLSLGVLVAITAIAVVAWIFRDQLHKIKFFSPADPLAELNALMPELTIDLKGKLESLLFLLEHTWHQDGMKAIGPFSEIIAPWYYRVPEINGIRRRLGEVNVEGRFDDVISALQKLNIHVVTIGPRLTEKRFWDESTTNDFIRYNAQAMADAVGKIKLACQDKPASELVFSKN